MRSPGAAANCCFLAWIMASVPVVSALGGTGLQPDPHAKWSLWAHPGPRRWMPAAFDTNRGRLVTFGGWPAVGNALFTYEWDGVRWLRAATLGPPIREGHAMTFDAGTGEVILFGGSPPGGLGFSPPPLDDTWSWDGTSWTQLADGGPAGRERHAMAYDTARGEIVLFGGLHSDNENFIVFGDTWVWDGATWTQVSSTGPSPRYDVAMAYDEERERVVLYGGADGSDMLGDTWEWDGQTWVQVSTVGPPCRASHMMTYDADRQRTVVFGGAAPCVNFPFIADQQDTWEWDGVTWQQVANFGPFKRRGGAMVYDSVNHVSLLFAGWPAAYFPQGNGGSPLATELTLSDLWAWDGSSWTQLSGNYPRGRYGHEMAYDAARGVSVFFGGRVDIAGYESETWEFDGESWVRKTYESPIVFDPTKPRPRAAHGMAYHAGDQAVYMFGGTLGNAGPATDEMWKWQGAEWIQVTAPTQPSPRYSHGMVYDSRRNRLVVFGGSHDGDLLSDTWEYDGVTWTQVPVSGPSPRFEFAMVYDETRGRTVLFGGSVSGSSSVPMLGDTWEYDGQSWTLVSEAGPPPRQGAAAAYDSARGIMVVRGGIGTADGQFVLFDDAWSWDGAAWRLVTDVGPGPRYVEALAYDSQLDQMVLFGGTNEIGTVVTFEETWLLSYDIPGDLDQDGDVDLADLGLLLSSYGCPEPPQSGHCAGDADGDGDTDLADLGLLLANYGS